MACHLVGAKPLSEPMLEYHQLDPKEQTTISYQENAFEKVVCEMAAILSPPQCVKSSTIRH